jgi:primosomal protein N' (replication factor Y)
VLLAVHRAAGRAACHYCLKDVPLPRRCADCGAPAPQEFGAGTEKVQEEAARLFPGMGIVRMDTDAMKGRAAVPEALRRFRDGEARILVGTKMVGKGLHFPNVTLVGVVSADTAFHLPDFRCAEQTYQELTHVMGRPGRGEHPGEVVVQTYHPKHYSVVCAAGHDAGGFYEREFAERRALGYPPFGELVRLLFEGRDEAAVERLAGRFTAELRKAGGMEVLGPQPAPVARLRGRRRMHALVKASDGAAARRAIADLLEKVPLRGGVDLTVDVDPYESV